MKLNLESLFMWFCRKTQRELNDPQHAQSKTIDDIHEIIQECVKEIDAANAEYEKKIDECIEIVRARNPYIPIDTGERR